MKKKITGYGKYSNIDRLLLFIITLTSISVLSAQTFDFGDAPDTYELNNSMTVVPARHIPVSTLYLGNTYDTETSKQAVASGADNGGANGDGLDEDGITGTLPQLNANTTSYSVDVNIYKTIAGIATLHAWIDMDGDGRFSAYEYTYALVFGAFGSQTVTLSWSSPFYFNTGAQQTYMRLRFTTATLKDNTSTNLVDERSIADGLDTGVYGTIYANGEIEDYPVPLPPPTVIDTNLDSDKDGIPDYLDLDSDNDGILNGIEGPISLNDTNFKIYNTPNYDGTTAMQWNLYITGREGTLINYTPYNGTISTATIPASGILVINLDSTQVPDWPINQVTDAKYVEISSSAPISVMQEIYGTIHTADAAVVYPTLIWGIKYTVNVYNNPASNVINNNTGLQIFSNSDNNIVTIRNKAGTVVTSFTLNNGQNYIYENGNTNLTGYTVTSSRNVGVMVYTRCTTSPVGACDNLLEHLLPDRLLGSKFLTRSPGNNGRMTITAIQDNTVVKIDNVIVNILAAGDSYIYTQNANTAQIIETNVPVQFTKVVPYDYDPSITTVQDVTKATYGPARMIIPASMITSNNLTVFVKTTDTGKMLFNGNLISGWVPFTSDPNYSYVTLTQMNGIAPGSLVEISSITGVAPFLTDWYGIGDSISDATPLSIGGINIDTGTVDADDYKDSDNDGIPDYLDLDSDNDGCLDALEGDDYVINAQLVTAGGTLTVGIGSSAPNQNLCNSCVDAQGVPLIVNPGGGADLDGKYGQGLGSSINPLMSSCLKCYKPGATGAGLDTKFGITSLARAGASDPDNWPMVRKGGWLALESKTKGFVVNRVAFDGSGNPVGIAQTDFVEGMIVYDTTNNCLKVYTSINGISFSWYCMSTQTCPD